MSDRLLAPFAGLRAAPEQADAVAAPPYDVLSRAEARAAAKDRPWSFLHVSRPEIDLPPGTADGAPALYDGAAAAFTRMIESGVLIRDPAPRFYAYRMETDGRSQTGLVAAASLAAYKRSAIKRHESTRPPKVEDRARHIAALGAQTGPILTIHRPDEESRCLIAAGCDGPPLCRAVLDGRVTHTLWSIDGTDEIEALAARFDEIRTLYIADGHHRAAAAQTATGRAGATAGRMLTVCFPADEVRILGYHRIVRDLNGLTTGAFLRAIGEALRYEPADGPVAPEESATFGMYLEGRWYRLAAQDPPAAGTVVDRLDVSRLTHLVLAPILGVGDHRLDPRIDFVGGGRGVAALAAAVDRGDASVAFSLYPTSVDDLMAVADAGAILPPKTTWFEPKLADGLVSLVTS